MRSPKKWKIKPSSTSSTSTHSRCACLFEVRKSISLHMFSPTIPAQKFAEKFKVEALPAFVVMQNFVKKRHVVGTADLKKEIDDAYAKFERNAQVDSSPNNGSEQRQAEENSQQELERHWSYPQQEKAARSSGGRPIGPARARVKNALLDNLLRFLEKRYRR
ncbi:hypothetical protein SETIT_8G058900v2 [Setaria italica]|uniref:Thioredoxin domain-containing protein n=1 Tax=Setaria italica TaxID=4555 RepID=K3ZK36_SETIT|nr:hypothetical protein SETIT_8G058900v2 [Setaria italica]